MRCRGNKAYISNLCHVQNFYFKITLWANISLNIIGMKTTTKSLFITIALIVLPFASLLATPASPGGDAGAPIDGGISLLLAAGIGYGAKKIKDARKKSTAR